MVTVPTPETPEALRKEPTATGRFSPPFPLPVSAFEAVMLSDDHADYPMVFTISISLSGILDREAFQKALGASLARHPLLNAVVHRSFRGGMCWIPVNTSPDLQWLEVGRTHGHAPSRPLDLFHTPGLRIRVRTAAHASEVEFDFHHAATDGLGAMRFIGDLLAYYGQSTAAPGDEVPSLDDVNPIRLLDRGQLWPDHVPLRRWLPRLLVRSAELLIHRPRPLAGGTVTRRVVTAAERDPCCFVTRVSDRALLRALKQVARRHQVTMNDLLTAVGFQTLSRWNTLQGQERPQDWLRLVVPVSLRTPIHDDSPAANVVGYMVQSRRQRECVDFDATLSYVAEQSRLVVGGIDSRLFVIFTDGLRRMPGLLRAFLTWGGCLGTAVFTNVGDVRRQFHARFPLRQGKSVAGGVTLEALLGTAPLRPGTRLAVASGTYASHLYVNMRCDPAYFSREDAEQLMDLYFMHLATVADRAEPTTSHHSCSVDRKVPSETEYVRL